MITFVILFKFNVKVNFRSKYADVTCPICKVEGSEDIQQHVYECIELLKNKNIVAYDNIVYSHIFDKDMEKQVAALRLLNLWSERQAILKAQQEEENQPGDPVQTVICFLCFLFNWNKLLLLLFFGVSHEFWDHTCNTGIL